LYRPLPVVEEKESEERKSQTTGWKQITLKKYIIILRGIMFQ
jgi:hypothetical protein